MSTILKKDSWINKFISDVPGLAHRTYFSRSMKMEIGYAIYLPPDYRFKPSRNDFKKKQYPVIYWLHGKGGDEASGFRVNIPAMFHKAIIEASIGSAITVFPNCGNYSMFCDSLDKKIMGETILISELIPLIDSTYSTIKSYGGRGIEGFSMGGFGAVKLAFKYPDMFSSVVTYAGSFHDLESVSKNRPEVFEAMFGNDPEYFQQNSPYLLAEKNVYAIKKNVRLKFINGSEDFTLQNNTKLNNTLDDLDIKYDFSVLEGFYHTPTPYYESKGLEGFKFHATNFRSD